MSPELGGIKNIASALLNPKVGGGLGATLGFVVEADLPWSVPQLMTGRVHAPNIEWFRIGVQNNTPWLVMGIVANVASQLAKGIHPLIPRVGKFIGATTIGYFGGAVAGNFLASVTHSNRPKPGETQYQEDGTPHMGFQEKYIYVHRSPGTTGADSETVYAPAGTKNLVGIPPRIGF